MGVFEKMVGSGLKLFGGSRKDTAKPDEKPRAFFVTHEATRTGAPKIILNLLKHFHQNCDIECETLMHSGGHLVSDFQKYSVVDCFTLPTERSDELTKRVRKAVSRQKNRTPLFAICNSMESRHVCSELSALGIPTISLVHELPSSYTEEDYHNIYRDSNKVVFPVQAVRESADAKTPIPSGKSIVLPQGLLDPNFGQNIPHEKAAIQIRRELGLPEDSFIVLGCGTLDLRKGIDHFVNIARRTIETNFTNRPIHFVWVGEGARWCHSPYHYVQIDLNKSVARDHVHFIGERENVEPYFMGADTFLMTSRVDPFPCVIHEAMAAGLPIITFADNGGAPEAVENGAGFVVTYGDYEQSAGVVRMLSSQPEITAGMRDRSKERVATRYRFEDYAEKMIDLTESILGQRIRKPAPPVEHIEYPILHRAA